MGIRKFRADYLFDGEKIMAQDAVLITDDKGSVQGVYNTSEAGEDIETHKGILTPGFINTHCHLELSHMKGRIAPGSGLIEFLTRVIRERNGTDENKMAAMQLAAEEMYDAGIVAVGDICNTTDTLTIKSRSKINWFNFIEVIGFNDKDAGARIEYATKVMKDFQHIDTVDDNNVSLTPHAPYSVSQELFKRINESSAGKVISIHNQESAAENEFYLYKTGALFELYRNLNIDVQAFMPSGKSSLQTYIPWLNKAAAIILVHDTFIHAEDIAFAQPGNTPADLYFCVCISANRYIESVNPPIELLRSRHCTITLGTDSYASNRQLSILEEMKMIHHEFPTVPLPELLQWATINGAKALNMQQTLGSFVRGKQPGVILINNITDEHLSAESGATRLL